MCTVLVNEIPVCAALLTHDLTTIEILRSALCFSVFTKRYSLIITRWKAKQKSQKNRKNYKGNTRTCFQLVDQIADKIAAQLATTVTTVPRPHRSQTPGGLLKRFYILSPGQTLSTFHSKSFNFVACNMLNAFGHPCWMMLNVVERNLNMFKFLFNKR